MTVFTASSSVMKAPAGIQCHKEQAVAFTTLDPRFRGNDGEKMCPQQGMRA